MPTKIRSNLLREQRFALCFFGTGLMPRFFVFGLRDNYIK